MWSCNVTTIDHEGDIYIYILTAVQYKVYGIVFFFALFLPRPAAISGWADVHQGLKRSTGNYRGLGPAFGMGRGTWRGLTGDSSTAVLVKAAWCGGDAFCRKPQRRRAGCSLRSGEAGRIVGRHKRWQVQAGCCG